MKYPPAMVAAVAAFVVLLFLLNVGSDSPCRSSSVLKLDGLCGPSSFYYLTSR